MGRKHQYHQGLQELGQDRTKARGASNRLSTKCCFFEVYGAVTFVIVLTNNRTECHQFTRYFYLRSDKDPAVG